MCGRQFHHYREVDNMYRQIRGWRHDYRNHIQTMKAYAAAEDWDAIKRYLDLLDEELTTADTVIKTGNPMTDAIEASSKLPKEHRVIRVYMDMKNTQLYISFTNFTAGKKMKKEKAPKPKYILLICMYHPQDSQQWKGMLP